MPECEAPDASMAGGGGGAGAGGSGATDDDKNPDGSERAAKKKKKDGDDDEAAKEIERKKMEMAEIATLASAAVPTRTARSWRRRRGRG